VEDGEGGYKLVEEEIEEVISKVGQVMVTMRRGLMNSWNRQLMI
jgi:hypothetical protein